MPQTLFEGDLLSALKEKKRTVEKEDQLLLSGQKNKRRHHDSSESGHSALEPLVVNNPCHFCA